MFGVFYRKTCLYVSQETSQGHSLKFILVQGLILSLGGLESHVNLSTYQEQDGFPLSKFRKNDAHQLVNL